MSPSPKRGELRAITSLQNERVKLIRSLEMRKARRDTGLFVAEGASVLVTARDAGWAPRLLALLAGSARPGVHRQLLDWAQDAGAECLEVSEAVLAKLAAKDNPQTMLGVFEQRWANEPDAAAVADDGLWVALEAIRDPGNLGTIVRTADAVGASGVMLIGASVDPYAREAVRATMGSIFNVPLLRLPPERFLALAAAWRGDIVGTHLSAREDFRAVRYRSPTLLLMGSEGPGLSPELGAACSRLVKIPMAGRLDSLNLAVATALVLYEIKRERLRF
jgi:TrmH family RNA methyltransferase